MNFLGNSANVSPIANEGIHERSPITFSWAPSLRVAARVGFRSTLREIAYISIVKVKSLDALAPIHDAQVLTYLKLSGLRIGLLINFNVLLFKQGLPLGHLRQQPIVSDSVEIAAQVDVDDARLLLNDRSRRQAYRFMSRPLGTVSKRPRLEVRLEDRFQDELERALHHPVPDRGN